MGPIEIHDPGEGVTRPTPAPAHLADPPAGGASMTALGPACLGTDPDPTPTRGGAEQGA